MRTFYRRITPFGIVLVTSLALLPSTEAAVPRLVMVYGPLLSKPIVIDANATLLVTQLFERQGLVSIDGKVVDLSHTNDFAPDDMKNRPYLDLALFWGAKWVRYADSGKPLDELRPEDAARTTPTPASRGRYYPACGGRPAAISLYTGISPAGYTFKRLPDGALKLLEDFGVPIRAMCP